MAKHRPIAPTHTLNYLPLGSFKLFFLVCHLSHQHPKDPRPRCPEYDLEHTQPLFLKHFF